MKATMKSGNFKPVPLPQPQQTVARCFSTVHVGTIPNFYNGVQHGVTENVFIWFELPELQAVFSEDKGPQPFSLIEEVKLSLRDNSNFSKLICSWRGKGFTQEEIINGFSPKILLGKTALVQFNWKTKGKFKDQSFSEVTNENTNLVLGSIMKKPESMQCPPQINQTLYWDWDEMREKVNSGQGFDYETWWRIPEFLRRKMSQSEEYRQIAPQDATVEQPDNPTSGSGPVQNTGQQYQQQQQGSQRQFQQPQNQSQQSGQQMTEDDF